MIHPFIEFQEKQEFNKLVRDKIPENIRTGGERVLSVKLERGILLDALRSKLVEEALEAKDAQDEEQIMEELADVEQIICSILSQIGRPREELEQMRMKKQEKRGGFDEGLVLIETNRDIPSEPTRVSEELLQGLDHVETEMPPVINFEQYAELSEAVANWHDSRKGDAWQQSIMTLEIPILRGPWNFKTKRVEPGKGKWSAQCEISGVRKKSKLRIELRHNLSESAPELFEQG